MINAGLSGVFVGLCESSAAMEIPDRRRQIKAILNIDCEKICVDR